MSRLLLNQVSKASNKMPMQVLQQMTSGGNAQPLADMTKKLAVCHAQNNTLEQVFGVVNHNKIIFSIDNN